LVAAVLLYRRAARQRRTHPTQIETLPRQRLARQNGGSVK